MLAGQTPESYTVKVTFALYLPNCGAVGYSSLYRRGMLVIRGDRLSHSSLAPAFHSGVDVAEGKLMPQI